MSNKNHEITRREFLRQSSCAALGLSGVINTMGMLRLANASVVQGNLPQESGYRALVCIYLAGGNDSNNMLVPMGTAADNPLRADYEAARVHVGLPSNSLHPLNIPADTQAFAKHHGGGSYQLGIHPNAAPLATLFNEQDLAFVCNVGTLLYPMLGRESYVNQLVQAPRRLFAHDAQTVQWQTSLSDQNGGTGWGGRMAELLHASYNGDASKSSMSASTAGISTFQRGTLPETAAFNINGQNTQTLRGYGGNYGYATEPGSTFENPIYRDTSHGHRLKAMESLWRLTRESLLEDIYTQRFVGGRQLESTVGEAFNIAASSAVDFDAAFAGTGEGLGDQLKTVAKLIVGRSALGNQRQIFYVGIGGYDTHGDLLESHAPLMGELSKALLAFRTALKAAGDWDKVVAFTASDFARTLSPNSTGTDHAWGGHTIVTGGPVKGGNLYGHYPSLKLGDHAESWDVGERGMIIPTTSVDQYAAPMVKWFGADSNSMETIFPHLIRFDDPFASSTANLQFI